MILEIPRDAKFISVRHDEIVFYDRNPRYELIYGNILAVKTEAGRKIELHNKIRSQPFFK